MKIAEAVEMGNKALHKGFEVLEKIKEDSKESRKDIMEILKMADEKGWMITENYKTSVEKSLYLAFYHAKEGDLISCLKELEFAESKIRDEKFKRACRDLIKQVEYMAKEGIRGESLVEEIGMLLSHFLKWRDKSYLDLIRRAYK